ncbi:hypothetical protein [Bacillus toyonensis]|nr:hypothetical protein [Bacillus toyonensis]
MLLRKDKDKPTLLDREVYGFWDNEEDDVYEDRVSDITYKAEPKETFKL